jgi:CDP-diacylglycerol--glycerol-3-phosphate 3-phosphatidyltransferase
MISNLVTASRIVLIAPLVWLMLRPDDQSRWMALGVLALAGFTDVIDGRLARRLGEVSAFGAMLDLISDRLLTAAVLIALMAAGRLGGWGVAAGAALIGRDLIVASFNEALPGRLAIRVGWLERVKIACQFAAFGLLIAPPRLALAGVEQAALGQGFLMASAALAVVTVADYSARVGRALRADGGGAR